MRRYAAAGFAVAVAWAAGANAQSLPCGGDYTVSPGDTLASIAAKHRDSVGFQGIFDKNRAIIGPDLNRIEIGQVYFIPCAGIPSQDNAAVEPEPQAPAPEPVRLAPVTSNADLVLLTSDNRPPLTDSHLPEGGVFTELVKRALYRGAPKVTYDVVFKSDQLAKLEDLRAVAGYDLGFPFIRPDCEGGTRLSPAMRARCAQFEYSDPFYEVTIGYFTGPHSDYRAAQTPQELIGTRVCRPSGLFTGDLEAVDLIEPNISMVLPDTLEYCIRALRYGEVDIVTAEVSRVKQEAEALGMSRAVVELEALSNVQTLRVAGPRGVRKTRVMLTALNEGLRRMRGSGEWFEIYRKSFADPSAPTN